jgi:transposase-like protein
MTQKCPKCEAKENRSPRYGYFTRSSDKKIFQRFKCRLCRRVFSQASFQTCYRQKKRKLNPRIFELFCSGVSQRRIARLLKINRKTVARKLIFLSQIAKIKNKKILDSLPKVHEMQFDDLETIEHTKCKPLSVILAVEKPTRRILGFQVSQMPAKGHLAKKALQKYGYRRDLRSVGRRELFESIAGKLNPQALIESDQSPHYPEDVKNYFPQATHKTFLSLRSAVVGQGELKKATFDPLFSINHTFAMLRANINRLFRRTWCTTKVPERLYDHLQLYTYYHNEILLKKAKNLAS